MDDVLYDKSEGIGTITLNRPERLNAFGGGLTDELQAALKDAAADTDVRAVILTGAGKAFSAGLDLKDRDKRPSRKARESWTGWLRGLELPRIVLNMDTPVIAAIPGPAIGLGFEVALLADYRIGSDNARMGDRHVKLGLIQDCGAYKTLPQLVGWANACKILLTGELFEAHELLQMGVLNEVVPAAELQERARNFAKRITCNAPAAVRMSKRLMRMAQKAELDTALDYSYLLMGVMQDMDDFPEGIRAFMEKREAKFSGESESGPGHSRRMRSNA